MKTENRELESITFGEIQKIADENNTEFTDVFKIIGDVRDTLEVEVKEPLGLLTINKPVGRPKGSKNKGSRSKYNHFWKKTEITKLLKLHKKGFGSKVIAKMLGKTRKQVYDKTNYELHKK